ncbi:hypothetical protein A3F07_01805 [candidate division WWE3 bacterium RIFCSPHIGHO2_12_FULL_38_15]|uniref:VWFA domain-containing protein n=1 Tax=candidate division WWE3 bacterium RIFCSPHIGHO2_02_FULL_38_14 TaxID=1802620 RepID=A0A1F4VCE0_UNCKA|nr:MAG: hypothetical protein A3F07_01805 [candidate division WWE3 bacterium RIFCSPHIGHO2_12_FULL_38_15]OGC52869.1 MAG: hypothetical protein A3B64_03580 [candidate division WWE3 bacterium RIFCSPLOWO2_01_FULL_37_24]OGC54373.1 MAG: hypothetical protein A3D91_00555 [candidate division WWE3 bacterium RIFCSPHIGHO2_02_FULL_38_14]HLB51616.1 vWA domain-containing protein [Patescibacteria group bacterium]
MNKDKLLVYPILILALSLIFVNYAHAQNNDSLITTNKTLDPWNIRLCESSTVNLEVIVSDEKATVRKKMDIVLVMDHSYSMFEYKDGRMDEAQAAAISFIDERDPVYDNLALVRFSTNAELQENLKNIYYPIRDTINGYYHDSFSDYTNIEDAINEATDELTSSRARDEAVKFIILVSDGGVNRPLNNGDEDKAYAKLRALDAADGADNENIIIYTIAAGETNSDRDLLQNIAAKTGGESFEATEPGDLIAAFEAISESVTNIVITDAEVIDILRPEFNIVPGSFNPVPAAVNTLVDGKTEIVWEVGVFTAGETRTFLYQITPTNVGDVQIIDSYPDSGVEFIDSEGSIQQYPFDGVDLDVSSTCNEEDGNGGDDGDGGIGGPGDGDDGNSGGDADNNNNDENSNGDGDDNSDNSDGDVAGDFTTETYRVALTPVVNGFSKGTALGLGNVDESTAAAILGDLDIEGDATPCLDPTLWWLLYLLQSFIHFAVYSLINEANVNKRNVFYVSQIANAAVFVVIFLKYFCPWWDYLISLGIGIVFLYVTKNKLDNAAENKA